MKKITMEMGNEGCGLSPAEQNDDVICKRRWGFPTIKN